MSFLMNELLVCLVVFSFFSQQTSGGENSNYTCWSSETCCDVRTYYEEESNFRDNLDHLLSRMQNADKRRKQWTQGRVSQFLVHPEDPSSSAEAAYGAWSCDDHQTPEECQACIDDLLDEIWDGIENVPSCNRSVGIQAVGLGGKCRVRYDMFQFWNPSDTCQPFCCTTAQEDGEFLWNYQVSVARAWEKTQSKLRDRFGEFDLSFRDSYDPTEEEEIEELESRVGNQFRPVVFIGYDCGPWLTGEECRRCVNSLVLSLDRWYFREGENCEEAVRLTANDDHSYYYRNPDNEPRSRVVHGGAGNWPVGQWPRGSCKFYFDSKPQYDSLYS